VTQTLSDAIEAVRDILDEANPAFYTDEQLTRWLNQGCADIARKAMCLRNIVEVPVTAETQNYQGPADMYELYRIEFAPTDSSFTYPLTFMGWQEADQAWGTYQSFPAAWPEIFTLWNNPGPTSGVQAETSPLMIRLFPVPAQGGNLNVLYYRNVVPVANDGDQLDTLPGWEDIVVEYAIAKAKRKNKERDWQDAMNFYEARLNDAIMVSATFQDQAGTFSTGQSSWPPWANGMMNSGEW
jgi:hypothetical protein